MVKEITIKTVVLGNTEHQLYTSSLLLLLRQGAGVPLDCFNTCNQYFTGNTNFT